MTSAVNLRRQKREATIIKTRTDECLEEISALQSTIENIQYGNNREAVEKAKNNHDAKADEVDKLALSVKEACEDDESTTKEVQDVKTAYDKLKDSSNKQSSCLEKISQISSMQELCVNISREFDSKAVSLVDLTRKDLKKVGDNTQGFVASSSQKSIFAVRDNWEWMRKLVNCVDIHLQNAAEYQQLFHEVEENTTWLEEDFKKMYDTFAIGSQQPDRDDGQYVLQKSQELLLMLRQWEATTNQLWDRAVKLVPVELRINGISKPVPGKALVDYSTPEFSIRAQESLVLLDNSDKQLWKVKNAKGEEGKVPALAVLIPGPVKEAVENMVEMRLKLLAAWTNALKVVGRRIILYTLMVLKSKYQNGEIMMMKAIEITERQDKIPILDNVENTLKPHWGEHKGFQILQERMLMVRMNLEDTKTIPIQDETSYKSMLAQINAMEQLMKNYQDLWQEWERIKTVLEFSRYPELMLVVEKWEDLKFVSTDQWSKLWKHALTFTEEEMTLLRLEEDVMSNQLDSTDYESDEFVEMAQQDKRGSVPAGQTNSELNGDIDEFGYHEVEVKRKYVITSVIDTRTKEEISLNDAIVAGIIKQEEGLYTNLVTGESIPIVGAMNAGLIKVEYKTSKRSKEKKSTIGIINVKTMKKPDRPFVVKTVKDTLKNEHVSPEEGIKRNILNKDQLFYRNLQTKEQLLLPEAAEKGLAQIEYTGPELKEEWFSKTYEVRVVLDNKKEIPFDEAVKREIIDKEKGLYRDRSKQTNDWMCINDAIKGGFMKARLIESQKLDSGRKKNLQRSKNIMSPLGVITAMANRGSFMTESLYKK